MKKRALCLLTLLALLALALTACGGKVPFEVEDVREKLEHSAAFSEQLEEMGRSTFVAWYGLDDAALTDGAVFASTGATAEEFAVLVFTDDAAARRGEEALKVHVQSQIEANTDYRPADVPKLEKAVVERRENTLLLVVANDYEAAQASLG